MHILLLFYHKKQLKNILFCSSIGCYFSLNQISLPCVMVNLFVKDHLDWSKRPSVFRWSFR